LERRIKMLQACTRIRSGSSRAEMRLNHDMPGGSAGSGIVGSRESARREHQGSLHVSTFTSNSCFLHPLSWTMSLLVCMLPCPSLFLSAFCSHKSLPSFLLWLREAFETLANHPAHPAHTTCV
jgi:hypothetical protein